MYAQRRLLSRALRAITVLIITAVVAALLPASFASAAPQAAPRIGAPQSATIPSSSTNAAFPTGSLIVDMGASPQTNANGLKPYGFVYELLTTYKIPVSWAIKNGKASMGANDFTVTNVVDLSTNATVASKSFAGSSFIISGDFAGDLPAARLTYWKGQGVKFYRSTAPMTGIPQFSQLRSWPRIVLDADSGAVADKYYSNAGIPSSAYREALPSALTACDDLFVFPHADPTWALHKNLKNFNNSGGFIFGQCHAPSVLENIDDPNDAGTAPDLNFLSVDGLVSHKDHQDGTLPYTYRADWSDPIQQITATLDDATENGSEQIFLPKAGGWRPTTKILVSDPDHPELNGGSGKDLSPGKAAVTAYGRGFGSNSNGLVMYQAAHDFAKSNDPANVSAQRTFMNFNLLAGIERSVTTTATVPSGPINSGATIPVSATATGGSGSYTYAWTSSCGGTFANGSAASTTFTAPTTAASTTCTIRVTVTDSCGRVSFDAKSVTVNPPPPPSPSLSLNKSVSDASGDGVAQLGETLTYSFSVTNTGNVALSNVTITDAKLSMSNVACVSSLAVGQTKPCTTTKTYVVTASDIAAGQVSNTATASATPSSGGTVTASDTEVITAPATPAIKLEKSVSDASGDGVAQLGETLTYTFKVTNTGNVPLSNITISDPKLVMSDVTCTASLAVGATYTCPTKTYVVTGADIANGSVDNTATAKGSPPSGGQVSGTSSASISAPAAPAIKVVKTVSDANNDNMAQLGETLTYTFTVTNTGNVPLTNVKVTDAKLGLSNADCVATLAAGAQTTCPLLTAGQKTYTVQNQDVSNGTVSNTATVTGTPPTGTPPTGSSTVTIATQSNSPAIHVAKSVSDQSGDGIAQLGETLTYSFTVTNSGNVPLNNVKISDPKLGLSNADCVATLAVGAQTNCPLLSAGQKTYTVTASDINNGVVDNTATAKGTPSTGGNDVTGTGTATIPAPATPAIKVVKSVSDASGDGVAQLGETLTYTFQVTNTGNVPLTSITISDSKLSMSNVACVSNLAVGETKTCPTATYVVGAVDIAAGAVNNTATAKGTPPSGGQVSGTGSATIPAPATPAIKVVKSVTDASGDEVAQLGEVLTYTFTVTNTGNVPLDNVKVTDAKLGLSNADCVASLAVGAQTTCPLLSAGQKTYTVTALDVANGSVDNTVTAKGTPSTGGGDVTGTGSASIPTEGATASIAIEKTVADSNDADSIASEGETLTYTFKVTNTGNVDLSDIRITDGKLSMSGELCTATLTVGQTFTCPTETYTVTAGDVSNGSVDNTATVTGKTPSNDPVTNQGSSTIPTDQPSISMTKTVTDESPSDGVATEGEVLTYTFTVTNTGNVPLTNVTISDAKLGLANEPCVANLAVNATTTCPQLTPPTWTTTAGEVAAGSVNNTATGKAKAPNGDTVQDQASASIPAENAAPQNADLSITKTVDTAQAAPGHIVTYTLKVKNQGPGDAANVVVTDQLPSGVTFQTASAPCTNSGNTVTCALGTVGSGDTVTLTIKVKVDAIGGGDTSHQHQLDYTKVESHLSSFDGDTTTASVACPSGYLATDGSVRLDHVDQGTGTFEDAVVLVNRVTADTRGWTGTLRNDSTGQVQAKVNVVCMSDKTVSGEDHSHDVVTSGPIATTQAFAPGRTDIDLTCGPGKYAIAPSFVFTAGEGQVSTRRTAGGGWRFTVDVDSAAEGTFSIRCLSVALAQSQGHSHDLKFAELSDSVSVPAGGTVERKLTCADGYKGIVAWAYLEHGLVSLGNDPQPITRVFKFYNPTGSPLTAEYGLLCVAIRTNGGASTGGNIKNTAHVATSSTDASTADDQSSATFTVNATGVAVAPRASVITQAGHTKVKLAVKASGKRSVKLKLLAMGKVKGTSLKSGSLVAKSKATLRGKDSVRLLVKGSAVRALKSGKLVKARLVVTDKKGRKDVRIVKIRR